MPPRVDDPIAYADITLATRAQQISRATGRDVLVMSAPADSLDSQEVVEGASRGIKFVMAALDDD